MNNKASITALMSAFGRAFHAENEEHPVFADHLAYKALPRGHDGGRICRCSGLYPRRSAVL